MRLVSGLLKLHIIKHFLEEQCSGCKHQQLAPCLIVLLLSPLSGKEDLLILQNPTHVPALFQPPCCSPGFLLCVFVLYKGFSRKSHFPLCSVYTGVYLLHWIMSPGVRFILMV